MRKLLHTTHGADLEKVIKIQFSLIMEHSFCSVCHQVVPHPESLVHLCLLMIAHAEYLH